MSARQAGATQNAHRDRLKLKPNSKGGVHYHQLGGEHHSGNCCGYTHQSKHRYCNAVDIDTGSDRSAPIPPMAQVWRPNGVCLSKRLRRMNTAIIIKNGTGRPKILPLLSNPNSICFVIITDCPCVTSSATPRTTLIIPKVTTKAGSLSLLIKIPFQSP